MKDKQFVVKKTGISEEAFDHRLEDLTGWVMIEGSIGQSDWEMNDFPHSSAFDFDDHQAGEMRSSPRVASIIVDSVKHHKEDKNAYLLTINDSGEMTTAQALEALKNGLKRYPNYELISRLPSRYKDSDFDSFSDPELNHGEFDLSDFLSKNEFEEKLVSARRLEPDLEKDLSSIQADPRFTAKPAEFKELDDKLFALFEEFILTFPQKKIQGKWAFSNKEIKNSQFSNHDIQCFTFKESSEESKRTATRFKKFLEVRKYDVRILLTKDCRPSVTIDLTATRQAASVPDRTSTFRSSVAPKGPSTSEPLNPTFN